MGKKHSEFVGAPDTYEYESPFDSVEVDLKDGPLKGWCNKAREMGLSQRGFDDITDSFVGAQVEMEAKQAEHYEMLEAQGTRDEY